MRAIPKFAILMVLITAPNYYANAQNLLEAPSPAKNLLEAPMPAKNLLETPKPAKNSARWPIPQKSWLIMSTLAYTATALDMHATADAVERKRKYPLYYAGSPERNPLARPFVTLPRPAYYACGFALTTGINWLGYRMSKSRRWQKVWWLPQSISISANSVGYQSQRIN